MSNRWNCARHSGPQPATSTCSSCFSGIGSASERSTGEDVGKFARQHLAAVHGNQLPQLHRRAAQPRQFIGEALGIGGIEQQAGQIGAADPSASRAHHHRSHCPQCRRPVDQNRRGVTDGKREQCAGGWATWRVNALARRPAPVWDFDAGLKRKRQGAFACRQCSLMNGDPYGTRTRVFAVKGRRPRPLDEGASSERPPVIGLGPWRQPLNEKSVSIGKCGVVQLQFHGVAAGPIVTLYPASDVHRAAARALQGCAIFTVALAPGHRLDAAWPPSAPASCNRR